MEVSEENGIWTLQAGIFPERGLPRPRQEMWLFSVWPPTATFMSQHSE